MRPVPLSRLLPDGRHPDAVIAERGGRVHCFAEFAADVADNLAWIGFFLVNGTIAVWTVVWGTIDQWALYNGLIAYLLIGAMFAGELLVRRRVMPKKGERA